MLVLSIDSESTGSYCQTNIPFSGLPYADKLTLNVEDLS